MIKQKIREEAKMEAVRVAKACGCELDKEFIRKKAEFYYQVMNDNYNNIARESAEGNQQLK